VLNFVDWSEIQQMKTNRLQIKQKKDDRNFYFQTAFALYGMYRNVFPTVGNLPDNAIHVFPTVGNLPGDAIHVFPLLGSLPDGAVHVFPLLGHLPDGAIHVFPIAGNKQNRILILKNIKYND
jgi:hypothetical protein